MDKTEAQGSKSGLAGAMEWLDKRFPATETFEYHMSKYYAPKNFNFWYYFGFLAMFVLVNQLLTGVWLTMNYVLAVTAHLPRLNTSCRTSSTAG